MSLHQSNNQGILNQFIVLLKIISKWTFLSLLIGALVGSASAFFLSSLDWVTNFREDQKWVIACLPLGGLGIGLCYHYWGQEVVKGNNLIIEEFLNPQKKIPLRMAPFILFCTIATHLFGGSAGREGTAIQMGGSIADQFTGIFKLNNNDRKLLLILGISSGFAAIFGTPFAGAIFALEILYGMKIWGRSILPSILTAFAAHHTCLWWNISHTHYEINFSSGFKLSFLGWSILAGIIFGLTAFIFIKATKLFENQFKERIKFPPLRPFIGGVIIAIAVYLMASTKYIGLGIPIIENAFKMELPPYDFLIKIAFTAFTLGAGFKGGEVTPLFFIGATLGNALSLFLPLPMALLAGMGFVAIFAGATNTPIACTIMSIELFGLNGSLYIGLACIVAYFFSGQISIYSSQPVLNPKNFIYQKLFNKSVV